MLEELIVYVVKTNAVKFVEVAITTLRYNVSIKICPVSSIGRTHDYGSYDRGSTPLLGTAQVLISPIVELGVLIRLVNVKRLYAAIV